MSKQEHISESDRIVDRGREERAALHAQGLKPSADEVPRMALMNKTQQETYAGYKKRIVEHKVPSNLINKLEDEKS